MIQHVETVAVAVSEGADTDVATTVREAVGPTQTSYTLELTDPAEDAAESGTVRAVPSETIEILDLLGDQSAGGSCSEGLCTLL